MDLNAGVSANPSVIAAKFITETWYPKYLKTKQGNESEELKRRIIISTKLKVKKGKLLNDLTMMNPDNGIQNTISLGQICHDT